MITEEIQKKLGLLKLDVNVNTSFLLGCVFFKFELEGYQEIIISDYDFGNNEEDVKLDDEVAVLIKKQIDNRLLVNIIKVSVELLTDEHFTREEFINLIIE